MAEPGENLGRRVLHVHPPSLASANEMAGALADAGCVEVSCPDVYRALARLGRGRAADFLAVVVCVDQLDAGELEFFRLVGRHYPDLGVYVYGQPHARAKAESAVKSGADAVVRVDGLANVLGPPFVPRPVVRPVTETSCPPAGMVAPATRAEARTEPQPTVPARDIQEAPGSPAPVVSAADVQEPLGAVAPAASARDAWEGPAVGAPVAPPPNAEEPAAAVAPAAEESRPEPTSEPKQERTSTARVPWLRYEDTPKRTPPKRSEPEAAEPRVTPLEPDAPLLTPAELEALIGEEDGNNSTNGGRKRRRPS